MKSRVIIKVNKEQKQFVNKILYQEASKLFALFLTIKRFNPFFCT